MDRRLMFLLSIDISEVPAPCEGGEHVEVIDALDRLVFH
jgi:hypothetical protein